MSKVDNIFKGKILVLIDDNEMTRSTLKHKFETLGATVYAAGHTDRARSIIRGLIINNQPPNLILVDVRLSDSYGLSALRDINDTTDDLSLPIIVVSSGFDHLAISKMMLLGAVSYIEKPVLTKNIIGFTAEILETIDQRRRSKDESSQATSTEDPKAA